MERVANGTVELWRYTLDRPVGGSGVGHVDVVIVELEDVRGQRGWGLSYVLAGSGEDAAQAARRMVDDLLVGRDAIHPEVLSRRAMAAMNRTGRGPLQIGLAAVDVAAWDLHAKQRGLPLGVCMGGAPRAVPVYGSGGLRAEQDPDEAAEVCRAYAERGVSTVKPRVAGTPHDRKVLAGVRDAVGDRIQVAVDANEKCRAVSANWLARTAQEFGLLFVEEPLPAHDLAGHRMLAASGVAIATGEHLQGLAQAVPYIADGLCQLIQPDLAMMGGLGECLRVARFAEALGVDVAPHFLPNLFVHLAAASPAVTLLEDFPLLEPLFGNPPPFDASGHLVPPAAPGHGLVLADGARETFLRRRL